MEPRLRLLLLLRHLLDAPEARGLGPLLEVPLGAEEVQGPRVPSVLRSESTVAGSVQFSPRGGGAWVTVRALASAAEAEALVWWWWWWEVGG